MKHYYLILLLELVGITGLYAQTDYTNRILNPSFEKDAEGWTQKGMAVQSNNVFDIKQGSKYMEKWTGRGGAVGDAFISQVLSNLPPGNYELTVAAQNIQEDTPTKEQSGAWIYAENSLYPLMSYPYRHSLVVTVRNQYTLAFNHVSGDATIGFKAEGATGNWIAVDNFRLTQVGTNLREVLDYAIVSTEDIYSLAIYGNVERKEIQQLKDAIDSAKAVRDRSDATCEEQAAAIVGMEQAVMTYRLANATPDEPLDMTDRLVNPDFEKDGLDGWTVEGMGVQGNSAFSIKNGQYYVERWTGRGGQVGNGRVAQVVKGLPAGRYRLKAAAQNIQEDTPQKAQTGAWLFANGNQQPVTVRDEYTLEFVLVSDELEVGFEAVGATGNWLSVDNFRLEYIGDSSDDITAEFLALLAKAGELVEKKMNAQAYGALLTAINAATPLSTQPTTDGWAEAAHALEEAIKTATASQEVFARLSAAIATANGQISTSTATQKEEYQAAIKAAQAIYDADTTTDADAEAAIVMLDEAYFAFRILNGSTAAAPTVKTDPRFVRGCTWAFGRSTVSGSDILEQGFCWSEQPDPKVTDHRTTEYLNQAGKIYWLRDLKPATIYYMRAYAINKDYAVGYGDVIKFSTVPKGTVGHWYNNGGDEETNNRINYAINTSMDYYWNNLTSIYGFGISVTYSPGTPTADCSYGGWMRVGESSSYQQPGTIMHEAFHGIGVGTHDMWWNGEMRSAGNRGDWLGDRVTEAVRFWDNSTTAVITGDDMHLWPYGCNGAHEDTHNDNLYCMMGILAQALNEDGLPGSGEIGYALPYYAFSHEDGVKYYIKNEDENRGLRSAYLVETVTHTLEWKTMSAEEAAADDAAAWYISFSPDNQYYQLRNAATGYYMTYNGSFKTLSTQNPQSAQNIHLMRGRVDVGGHRGYYFIHPESSANPPCLNATANGKTGTASWNIAKSATTQRWLIMTAEEAVNFDNGNIGLARKELNGLLAKIRKLAETPHHEDVAGADATLNNTLTDLETQSSQMSQASQISTLTEQARAAAVTFLSSVSVTDVEQPFDLTFMIENPDFDNDATTGWTSSNGAPGYDAQGAEFFEKTFNYYQILNKMPSGNYELRANAFQRPGSYENVLAPYNKGTAKVTTSLYINNTAVPVKHICDDRQPKTLFNDGGWGSDSQLTDGTYIPNCMTGAEKYFAKGLYDSRVVASVPTSGSNLRIGIKCTSAPTAYWTMFDHFRLYFFGGNKTVVGIDEVPAADSLMSGHGTYRNTNIYDLQGRKVSDTKAQTTNLNSQISNHKFQIIIVNGKKYVIRPQK